MVIFIAFALVMAFIFLLLFWTNTSSSTSKIQFTPSAFSSKWEPLKLEHADPSLEVSNNLPLSNRIVAYRIQVQLDEKEKQIIGREWITWKNPGVQPVDELYIHLYPNAFQSKNTTFMKESGGKLRQDRMHKGSFGEIKLLSMRASEGYWLADASYVRPDDGNPKDFTLLKVTLTEPVMPGDTIDLHIEFQVKLPYVFARMGYAENFIMAGQWFPKMAAYETAGTRNRTTDGWNLHQYHGNSEFYANFGSYDVEINVPNDYAVAATGIHVNTNVQTESDRKTMRFIAEDVHDFAWSASPDFIQMNHKYTDDHVSDVDIKLYLQPEHVSISHRYLHAAKSALKHYSEWFGPYPYSTLSLVVPPAEANGAGGMEYPTLITTWGAEQKEPGYQLEQVIVHEIAHQYFYGMVASNEFEEAWLDEAFTSYAEDKLMKQVYGLVTPTALEASYITSPQSLTLPAWEYASHTTYAENVYIRGKLVLKSIEQQIGTSMMMKVMREYVDQWKFHHPSTSDFQHVLERVTGRDWDDFIQQYVEGNRMIDYAVEHIETRQIEHDEQRLYLHEIRLNRHGGTGFEVPILMQFEDGHQAYTTWDGEDNQKILRVTYSSPLAWVAIDPEHTLILENRRINNFMHATVKENDMKRISLSVARMADMILNIFVW